MKFEKTELMGVFFIEHDIRTDIRGAFVKNFQREEFSGLGLESDFRESYYTISKENVIRGMHFQVPPHDQAKLVTIIQGTVVDVILDLRSSSPTIGQHVSVELSHDNRKSIYIPKGCAHGFSVLTESATVFYMVTSEYAPASDKGIRYDSFGFDWRVVQPIISERDLQFPPLFEFKEYFE